MRTSENTDIIAAALLAFQAKSGPVSKNKGVKVEGASKATGESYGYKSGFATLDAIIAAIRDNLANSGISFIQGGHFGEKTGWTVVTRVSAGDQWYEVEYPVKTSRDGAQAFGGGRSFAKRWGINDVLGLEIQDDFDEGQGYKDAKGDARPAKRASAPVGLAPALAGIRGASTTGTFVAACAAARAAHSVGEASAEVERTIADWLVQAFGEAKSLDELTDLRDCNGKVKARGAAVLAAIQVAGARIEKGAP